MDGKHLTRASLIGNSMRIAKTYGHSVIGVRIAIAYERAVGCRDSILELSLARALRAGRTGFANTNGERLVLSAKRVQRIQRRLQRSAA